MNDLKTAQACAAKMYANDRASQALGIEIEIPEPGSAVATMTVREDMVNGFDMCHGGLIFTLADTAFAFACNAYNDLTVAGAGTIDFLRSAFLGDELKAVALEEHRGKRGGVYAVEVVNQRAQFVALFRGRAISRGEALIGED
jgi:acyl-CoA thioesterase